MSRRRWLVVVVVVALILAALAAYAVWIAQQETASAYPANADRTVELSSSVEYSGLGQMTASSDSHRPPWNAQISGLSGATRRQ